MATRQRCRFCLQPIHFVEPGDKCGWAHDDLPNPEVLRFWCGRDDKREMRRVEPRQKAKV